MSRSRLALLVLILLFAALLRSWHIADQSLWVDEGYAYYHAHYPSLIETLRRDTHPPLYFAGLRLWSEITGDSELALRWFSLLPSMLSIALAYQLGREIMRLRDNKQDGFRVGLYSALMMCLADAEIFLSQEVRHYTWLLLLVTAGMWMFLRWTRNHSRRAYVLWIIFTILAVYTHYITAFIGITQGLYALIALRGKIRLQAIAGLIISALALSPWILLVGIYQVGNNGANWSVPLDAGTLLEIRNNYFTQEWAFILGLMALGCVTVLYQGDSFKVKFHRSTLLLLLWLILPFLLTVIVNEFLPFLQPRRLNQWLPAIALLLAMGLANVRPPVRGLLVAILIWYSVMSVDFYKVKPDWRTVADMTGRYAVEGDLVLSDISGGDYQLQYYLRRDMLDGVPYSHLLDADVRYESLKQKRDFYPDEYQTWLPALIHTYDTIWLMYWSDDPSAKAWLDKLDFKQSAQFIYVHDGGLNGNINFYIYRYDRLRDEKPISGFENGMILQSATIDVDDLRTDLLWSADEALKRDYTVSAKLLDANGQVAAQLDAQPQLNQRPTSAWAADDLIFDPHTLDLREGLSTLAAGTYQAIVQVYTVDDSGLVLVPTEAGEEWAVVGTVEIKS